jgi:hypothetical protein
MLRAVVLVVSTSLVCAGCSGGGGSNELDRIDGPAVVDPDFGGIDGSVDGGIDSGGDDPGSGG